MGPPKQQGVRMRKSYKVDRTVEPFYTGGPLLLAPDSATLATAAGDDTMIVRLSDSQVLHKIPGDTEPVTALVWDSASKTIWVASRSLTVRRFEALTGKELRSWKPHTAPVAHMAVDGSGCLLATGSADRSARVWDIQHGHCTHAFRGHKGIVLQVAFHPEPRRLVLYTSSDEGEVKAWDLATRAPLATLDGHFSAVTSLALSPCGRLLLSAARDKVVMAWNTATNKKASTFTVHEPIEGLAVLPAGAALTAACPALPKSATTGAAGAGLPAVYFATAGEAGAVKLWRSDTGACVADVPVHAEATELQLVGKGASVLCATADARVITVGANPEPTKESPLAIDIHLIGNNDNVIDVCYAGADDGLLTVVSNSEAVRVHDAVTLSCKRFLRGHADMVLCCDTMCGEGGQALVVTGSKDRSMRVWDAESGECLAVGEGHVEAVTAVAFSNKTVSFAVTGGADKLLKVWDLAAATVSLGAGEKLRTSAAVSAHDKDINAVAVSPNNQLVASASQDRTARLWQLPDLTAVTVLKGHKRGIWQICFSPVEQVLATGSADKTIKVWSLADGSCLRTMEGHTAAVLTLAFGASGTQILSSGSDATLRLWSLKTSECIATFDNHEDKVWSLAARDDGATVVTGGADGRLTVWVDNTAEIVEAAAEATEAQWLQQQELDNALFQKDYQKAVDLAFNLKQPNRLRNAFAEITSQGAEGKVAMDTVLGAMDDERLTKCLEYVREWNTNAKFCHVAAAVLSGLTRTVPPARLTKLPNISDLLAGIQSYNLRHFQRMDRLVRSTYLLDLTLASMPGGLSAEAEEGAGMEGGAGARPWPLPLPAPAPAGSDDDSEAEDDAAAEVDVTPRIARKRKVQESAPKERTTPKAAAGDKKVKKAASDKKKATKRKTG